MPQRSAGVESFSDPRRVEANGGFVVVYEFMWRHLGLSGAALLVYARAFGFCKGGGRFFESKPHLAGFLGMSERTVFRAVLELVERGYLVEVGEVDLGGGRSVKEYDLNRDALPDGALDRPPETLSGGMERHDKMTGRAGHPHDDLSGGGVTDCHPIRKRDNKAYG